MKQFLVYSMFFNLNLWFCVTQPNLESINKNYFKFWVTENILVLFYYLGENKLVWSNKLLPISMKSINQIQKYPHIIELYAYTV